jgi:hypothetical protein
MTCTIIISVDYVVLPQHDFGTLKIATTKRGRHAGAASTTKLVVWVVVVVVVGGLFPLGYMLIAYIHFILAPPRLESL